MPEHSDWQLLDRFAHTGNQDAFGQLVQRHLNLVYGTALRTLGRGSPHLDDVVQAVFLLLTKKATHIPRRGALAGWLFRATRYCCANVAKTERRRRTHEREVSTMQVDSPTTEPLEPLLNDGLMALGERERQAILMHYLQRQSVEDAAQQLGISRAGAAKRLERGLQKLRAFFRKKGFAVPVASVVALLGAESAKAAPVNLAARLLSARALSTATVATSIAKGALHMMRIVQLKLAATCAALAVLTITPAWLTIAAVTALPAAATPAAIVAGRRPMLVRWDLLIDDAGAARVLAASTPIKTDSQGYNAYQSRTAALRTALAAGPAPVNASDSGHGIFIMPQNVSWSASMTGAMPSTMADTSLMARYVTGNVPLDRARNIEASIFYTGKGQVFAKSIKNGVNLDVQGTPERTDVAFNDNTRPPAQQAAMRFKGDVPLGEAIVFAHMLVDHLDVKIWHITVWEAFATSSEEITYLQKIPVSQWVFQGVDKALADADQAIAWSKSGNPKIDDVPPAFEKQLPNGTIVRLAAISRPAQWPDCWWDATGKAVSGVPLWDYDGVSRDKPPGLQVTVTAADPTTGDPTKPAMVSYYTGTSYISEHRSLAVGDALEGKPVEVGVASGPWKTAGKIAVDQEIETADVRVKLTGLKAAGRKNQTFPGDTWVAYQSTKRDDVQTRLVALDRQGKEFPAHPDGPEVLFSRQNVDRMVSVQETAQLDADDIAAVIVQSRPRVWMTFENFAAAPTTPPSQLARAAEPAPKPAPEPGSPEAFMLEFINIAATGDAQKIRDLMTRNNEAADQYAEVLTLQIAPLLKVRAAAEAKFGKQETATAMDQLLPQLDQSYIYSWKVQGDRASPVYKDQNAVFMDHPSLVRINGVWKLEVKFPENISNEMKAQLRQGIQKLTTRNTALAQLATDISAGKYKDAYEARDALVKITSNANN